LTELGRLRAREAFEQCRYVGPAPVPLKSYVRQCRRQAVTGTECTPESLNEAFHDLVIRANLLDELGPAVCSGKSIFIYGPPGNGKTMIAKGLGRFLNRFGGEIYIPYAIHTENAIITIYDPTIHDATDEDLIRSSLSDESDAPGAEPGQLLNMNLPDLRWRRVRRPVVITGGELTLDMLELQFSKTGNFYHAPLHIKANGGVFLIDDFGRQIVSPRDLLNRWILPLEERIDFLTLVTGKKFSVPFEQLIVFSTNLDPRELVDEAFLRRIRHKIEIGPPDRELFTDIFRLCCEQRNIPFNLAPVEHLYKNFYDQGKSPRSSDPRDLLEIAHSICRFKKQPFVLSEQMIAEATQRFFCQI
jgi:predicted ATPase with chaperone activity